MTFQAKLVDPNGKPKAIVGTHDRVASGKEFALFQHMLGMMALGCVPDEEKCDIAGRQMSRLLSANEIVDRAQALVVFALQVAQAHGWIVETADIDQIYEDSERKPVGFAYMAKDAADASSDEIPF